MKSTLFKAMTIIMGMVMSLSLASCGDDNDDNEPDDPKAVAYYEVTYATDLNEAWFKFFDVSIIYVNGAGVETTQPIKENTDLTDKIEAANAPKTVGFKIHVTRKATVPEVGSVDPIDFNGKAKYLVQAYCKDGSTAGFWGAPGFQNTNGTKVRVKDLEKFLQKYADADIFERSEEIKK